MTNTLLISKMMAADIVSFYQTIDLMNITQNRKDIKLMLAFRDNSDRTSFSWKDVHNSIFDVRPWDAPDSPLKAELARIYTDDVPVDEQITRFFERNKSSICAEVMDCMVEEGYEGFAVIAGKDHLVICSGVQGCRD